MQPFIPAATLQQVYGVFGHFYWVELASREILACRSVLELVAKTRVPKDLAEISHRSPDALFIMMNPGSSKPLVEVHQHLRAAAIHQLKISLVPTRPDTTQYQVMRLMQVRGWQHVRVLNLSDLRSPKSPEFIKTFQRLERDDRFCAHSVFDSARQEELAGKLPTRKTTPLVLAWGMSDKLDPLIERCLKTLPPNRRLKGLLEPGTVNKFRHPLPSLQTQQRLWLANMIRHFEE